MDEPRANSASAAPPPLTRDLASVAALAGHLSDAHVRIVDVRWYLGRPGDGRRAYDAGHIPGAIHLDVDGELAAPPAGAHGGRHPLPDPMAFAATLAGSGIGRNSFVVAYDDVGGWVAARLWWMLDDLGHRDVAVLDGGWQAWTAAGLPVTTDPPRVRARRPAALHLRDRWTRVIGRDMLRAKLGGALLLDARAAPRYRGEVEPIDPVAGHIPTARSAPGDGNLEAAAGRFLPPEALGQRFHDLGADEAREVVTYCGSGVSAAANALAMRLAGLADPILYAGSWSDWSSAGFPVATGSEPGEPPAR
jgi:thiosulfate/3-mercaptopyruvate sulfurtransferase